MELLERAAIAAFGTCAGFAEGKKTQLTWKSFSQWTPALYRMFRRVEKTAFRAELRYTRKELRERSLKPGFETLIFFAGHRPSAVMLVYQGGGEKVLYLDTLAVRNPGKGTGGGLLRAFLEEARSEGYRGIELDTENINDQGIRLVDWYRRFGFTVLKEEADGNVSMECILSGN